MKSSICSLAPEHLQSSVFAIAEMTQKGTSIFGPAITVAILQGQGVEEAYHEKVIIGVAAFMVCLGIPFLMFVNEKRGNECAEKIDKKHLRQLQREASIALGLWRGTFKVTQTQWTCKFTMTMKKPQHLI